MGDWPVLPFMPMLPILSTASFEAMGGKILAQNFGSAASNGWPGANRRVYVPFDMTETKKVAKLFTVNGAAVNGNIDIGIYDGTGTILLCSTGSTAQAGTNRAQVIAPTTFPTLDPGHYMMCLGQVSTTGTNLRYSISGALLRRAGCMDATGFPLPNPSTPSSITTAYLPHFGIIWEPRS